jgi:hypothetical protein
MSYDARYTASGMTWRAHYFLWPYYSAPDSVVAADSPGGICKLLSIQRGNFERILDTGRGLSPLPLFSST